MNAARLVDRLTRRGEALAAEPRIDRRVPEYLEQNLREVLERPYRLIFLVLACPSMQAAPSQNSSLSRTDSGSLAAASESSWRGYGGLVRCHIEL